MIEVLSTLSGQRIDEYVNPHDIVMPGFYCNGTNIEHWSFPCEYTNALSHAFKNSHGIICDGYISLIGNDDIEQVATQVHNWAKHLEKYGVI